MQRKVKQNILKYRWHNHLEPGVTSGPLTEEEEKNVFKLHKLIGNKWAEIAKNFKGRTDNVIKNYYYSTLRRQLRKIAKKIKIKRKDLPKEISLETIQQLLKKHNLPYSIIDRNSVREAIINIDKEPKDKQHSKIVKQKPYSLYIKAQYIFLVEEMLIVKKRNMMIILLC